VNVQRSCRSPKVRLRREEEERLRKGNCRTKRKIGIKKNLDKPIGRSRTRAPSVKRKLTKRESKKGGVIGESGEPTSRHELFGQKEQKEGISGKGGEEAGKEQTITITF